MDTGGSPRRQETMRCTSAQTRSERVLEQPNEPPLSEGHTCGSSEGSMKHIVELTDIIPPTPHDSPLIGGYTPRSDEGRLKLEELMDLCTTLSNKRRMIKELDKDENVNLVSKQGEVQETAEPSKDDDDATLVETLLNIKRSTTKDKEKRIMQETELPKKIKKIEMIHLSLDKELAQRLYAEELAKEAARQEQDKYNLEKALELQRQLDKREKDVDKEEMKLVVKIVLDEDIAIDAIPLATKPLVIVEYKIVKEGKMSTYHIIRADGGTKRYTSMIKFLENIDREDSETLWKLVKDKHGNTRPEEDYERVL
nr:hypothetical protein [Tanacetum cinerariifolium]